jgi:hypothetical protein
MLARCLSPLIVLIVRPVDPVTQTRETRESTTTKEEKINPAEARKPRNHRNPEQTLLSSEEPPPLLAHQRLAFLLQNARRLAPDENGRVDAVLESQETGRELWSAVGCSEGGGEGGTDSVGGGV